MKYREEIDGLRGLAVISVILFHARFSLFNGGFVGVDIFFVISGYLITTILIDDIENKRFSITSFYERRARRILPALFFMMLCCIPFAWLWMLPVQLESLSQSFLAICFFVSNIHFWQESNYFDVASEEKPLLHTWSLAVEEQYYVIFPIFLIFMWRFGRNRVFWLIVLSTIISLVLSEWAWRNKPSANFYLAPTRAWELLVGSITAFIVQKRGVRKSNTYSFLGLVIITFSIFYYDESIPFPSLYALAPVLGTALLVLFADADTFVAKILSTKFFVAIGLISYSAYLWHQPLFAFTKIRLIHSPGDALMLGLVGLSLLLGYLSWLFVENPFREKESLSRASIFLFSFVGIFLFSFIGFYGSNSENYLNKEFLMAPNIEFPSLGEKISEVGEICTFIPARGLSWTKECEFGNPEGDKTVVLVGDSHATAISYSLDELFRRNSIKGVAISLDGCEIVPYVRVDKSTAVIDCETRFDEFLKYIKAKNSDVVLVSRWSFRLYPIKGSIIEMPYVGSEGYTETDVDYREYDVLLNGKFFRDAETKKEYLQKYIELMAVSSKSLFLVYPIPETGINIEKMNRFYYKKRQVNLNQISIPYSDYEKRNRFVIETFNGVGNSNIKKIRPSDLFCNTLIQERCVVQIDGIPLYYDDDHLSKAGADILVDEIFSISEW